jgi:hypothetical protein
VERVAEHDDGVFWEWCAMETSFVIRNSNATQDYLTRSKVLQK